MSQIKKKFIGADQVDQSKVLLDNNSALRAKKADGSAEELLKLDADGVLQILKVPQIPADPTGASDVASKGYTDTLVNTVESALQGQIDSNTSAIGVLNGANTQSGSVAYQVKQVSDALATEVSRATGAESSLSSSISSEQSARISGDNALDARLDTLEGSGAGSVAKAQADAQSYADSQITALKGGASTDYNTLGKIESKIGFVLSNSDPAYLDSISEVVTAFQAADSNLNNAITNLSSAAGSGLNQEIIDRQAGDAALDSRLDIIEGPDSQAGSILKSAKDTLDAAKSYADGIVSTEQGARESADSALDGRLDILETDPVTKSYVDGAISTEQGVRSAADSALDSRLDTLEGIGAGSVAKAQADAQSYADGIVSAEASARESADNALDGRLDALELDPVTKGYVDTQDGSTLSSANSYTDGEITTLRGGVSTNYNTLKKIEDKIEFIVQNTDSAALDSLSEIVSAFQSADSSLTGTISALQSSLSGDIDAEESARIAADNALDGRLDVLEGSGAGSVAKAQADAQAYTDGQLDTLVVPVQHYQKVTLTSGQVAAGNFSVAYTVVGTPWLMVDGVMMRPGTDFSVSGSTITFSSASPALEAGDEVHVYFMRNTNPFV